MTYDKAEIQKNDNKHLIGTEFKKMGEVISYLVIAPPDNWKDIALKYKFNPTRNKEILVELGLINDDLEVMVITSLNGIGLFTTLSKYLSE